MNQASPPRRSPARARRVHDLNNLLAVITLNADALLDPLLDELSRVECARDIQRAAQEASELVVGLDTIDPDEAAAASPGAEPTDRDRR